jgi:hypothetical protein
MTFDKEKFKETIRDFLSPEEYQTWLQDLEKPGPKDHPCLVEEFFRKEAEKPAEFRQKFCMISCNCWKCLPYHM